MKRVLTTTGVLCIGLTLTADLAAEEVDNSFSPTDLIAAIVAADYPRPEYKALFNAAREPNGFVLEPLKQGADDSIALQVAWELVDPWPPAGRTRWGTSHPLERSRFIGFFEGRTRVNAPPWWRDLIQWGPFKGPRPTYTGFGVRPPAPPEFKQEGKQSQVIAHDGSSRIDAATMQELEELSESVAVGLSDERCFLATYSEIGFSSPVICVDRKTGKQLWTAETCGCWVGGGSGAHESWVEVIVEDGHVVVFGAAYTGFYAHAFRVADGKTAWRLSTIFESEPYDRP